MMEITDKSLIEAHCQGKEDAFAQIVQRHGGSVLGYLTKMCSDRERAEDFFQETFKRVHEKAHTLRGENFRSWLFTIATRVAIDGYRKNSRIKTVSLDSQMGYEDSDNNRVADVIKSTETEPAEKAALAEKIKKVREAIMELPAKQRATLVLNYYQRMSYREVAKVLGVSTGTVKRQMYRALKTLSVKLSDISGEVCG